MIETREFKDFIIDFDLPASQRYNELYNYFEPWLRENINQYWDNFYTDEVK